MVRNLDIFEEGIKYGGLSTSFYWEYCDLRCVKKIKDPEKYLPKLKKAKKYYNEALKLAKKYDYEKGMKFLEGCREEFSELEKIIKSAIKS